MENKQTGRRCLADQRNRRQEIAAVPRGKQFDHRLRMRLRGQRQLGRISLPYLAGVGRLRAIGRAGFVLTLVPVLAARARGGLRDDRKARQATAGRQNHRQKAGKHETGQSPKHAWIHYSR